MRKVWGVRKVWRVRGVHRVLLSVLAVGLVSFSASTAGAISLFLANQSKTVVAIGETFSIQLRMDTAGETAITSVIASVQVDPNYLTLVSGTSPSQILFNTSTSQSLSRVSQPVAGGPGDPAGQVHAANFVTANPGGSGVADPNVLLATLVFVWTGAPAVTYLAPMLYIGSDEVTVNQVDVTGSVSLGVGSTITVVPEPGTGLLVGLGLATLAFVKQRELRARAAGPVASGTR